MCRRKNTRCGSFRLALEDVKDLEPAQKRIIEERYLCLLENFENRAYFYAILFHTCRFIITVGSLIVPALLSIQYVDTGSSSSSGVFNPEDFSFHIYWTTWVISLLVTTANGVFTLFKADKKYYLLHTMLEQLRSEGWQYLELSGRFSGFYTPKQKATHGNQFLFFCHAVEKLKMKQVEEEYYKSTEANLHATTSTHPSGQKHDIEMGKPETKNTVVSQSVPAFFTDGLLPPTPLNPQLQQLLQALTVEGGNGNKQQATTESSSEVSVRPEMSRKPTAQESLLRQASAVLSKAEPNDRGRAEISTDPVEQQPKAQENA